MVLIHQETPENSTSPKRIKQTISIPFLWEEKPGTPKLDWKRVNPVMQMPLKLIASVPFQWEQKPGTPLPKFSHHPSPDPPYPMQQLHKTNNPFCDSDSDPDLDQEPDQVLLDQYSASLDHLQKFHKKNPFCDSSDDELEGIEEIEHGGMADSEGDDDNSGYLQAPSSPAWETESNASSYATTGTTTTLAGSSFLECMFPLLTPQSSFFESVGCSGIRVPPSNTCIRTLSNGGAGRKPLTLGEMILMSRRRSYLKKAVESHEDNHSTELMRRNAFGCCNIDVGGLNKLRRQLQLQLKLV